MKTKKILFTIFLLLFYAVAFPQNWTEMHKLTASDKQADDYFGYSVSVSGDYMVVGALSNDADGVSAAGSAYVYKKDINGNWTQIAKLTASDKQADDYFGCSVSISGNYIVVGADDEDPAGVSNAGSVYVFKNNGDDTYSQIAKITASDKQADDCFGYSVSISGDYIVVGAVNEDPAGVSSAGSAYVFKNNGSDTYTQIAKLNSSDKEVNGYFGCNVSIFGDYIVVGARGEAPAGVSDAGSAYVFKNNGSDTYTQIAKLTASDNGKYDYFGESVSILGDYIIVGAFQNANVGSVYVFKNNGSDTYTQIAKLTASDKEVFDRFGKSVSISGDYIVVGAYEEDPAGVGDAGSAYVFKNNGSDTYTQIAKLTASDKQENDNLGKSVSISGDYIVVGAHYEDAGGLSNAGSAYTFCVVPPTILTQPQDATACGTAIFQIQTKDCSGYQWQVSTDGGSTFTDLSDDATYSGSTTSTLTVNADATMDSYKYRCVVSNNAGSQNSDVVNLVVDAQAPQVAVTTIDKYLDASGNVQIYASEFTLTDVSEITDSTLSQSAFDCGYIGTNSITLTTQDACGNSATYDLAVNVADTISPLFTATGIAVNLDSTGSANITKTDVISSASDNCSLQDTVLSQTTFECANIGSNIVTVTVTDVSGNSTSQDITVTVADNITPWLATTEATVYLNVSGNGDLYASAFGVADNCTITDSILSQSAFDCGNIGINNITMSVTDANGNNTNYDLVVTVLDTIKPQLVSKDTTIYFDNTGNASITTEGIIVSTSDNCSLQDTALSQTSFDCSNIGANAVSVLLSDISGNSDTAYITVTVLDTIKPQLVAKDTTIYLDNTGNASITAEGVIVFASDNCSLQDTTLSQTSFDCANIGANIVSVLLSDISGNSDTAYITVTVLDTIRPEISCVENQEVTAGTSGVYVVNGTEFDLASSSDNCGVASTTNDFNSTESLDGAELSVGTHTITWTVTDDAGNQSECSFTVTVNTEDGINEVANSVKVYPNPSTGVFTIDLSNTNAESLQVTDVTGKVVLQQDVNTTATTVDLTGFANGIYTLKIQTTEGVEVMNIVKR